MRVSIVHELSYSYIAPMNNCSELVDDERDFVGVGKLSVGWLLFGMVDTLRKNSPTHVCEHDSKVFHTNVKSE